MSINKGNSIDISVSLYVYVYEYAYVHVFVYVYMCVFISSHNNSPHKRIISAFCLHHIL